MKGTFFRIAFLKMVSVMAVLSVTLTAFGQGKVTVSSAAQAEKLSNQDVSTTIIVDNPDYQVRCFTENYYITIKLQ